MSEHQPKATLFEWSSEDLVGSLVPRIKSWRPFREEDRRQVIALERPSSRTLFGNLEHLIELSAHRLVMTNIRGELIACICLRNYPNIPSIAPEVWTQVIWRQYQLGQLNNENTLFVHLLLWDERYNWELLCYFLKSLFLSLFRLEYVVLVMLPGTENAAMLSHHLMGKYFIRVKPVNIKSANVQTLYIAFRDRILPHISVRRAVAEDNDDLVDILDYTAPALKEVYGEFYVAEIVLSPPPTTRAIIVAEIDNQAVGMMCLNTSVRLEKMVNMFDASTYHGFRQHSECETTSVHFAGDKDIVMDQIKPIQERLETEISKGQADTVQNTDDNYRDSSFSDDYFRRSYSSESTDDYVLMLQLSLNKRLSSYATMEDTFELFHSASNLPTIPAAIHAEDSLSAQLSTSEQTQFVGAQDVFAIELFGLKHTLDERMAIELLMAAFQANPQFSYCVLTVPSTRRHFPLLSYFVRVVDRFDVFREQRPILYAVQRNVLCSAIVVRLATVDDQQGIREFLGSIVRGQLYEEELMIAVRMHETRNVFPYVVVAEATMIGVCILNEYSHLATVRHNYNVDDYMRPECHSDMCKLRMMILHPAFMVRLPYILSELFRQSGFTNMFYMLDDAVSITPQININSMLGEMIPIRPRLRMRYDLDRLQEPQYPPDHVLHNRCEPFGLYFQNANSCTKRKVHINDQIVVVGCSETALAFLDHMIFHGQCKDMHFTHLTLISPNGLAVRLFRDHCDEASRYQFDEVYSADFVRRLAFRTWLNIIYGCVTKIDREKQIVYVDKKPVLYDRLYLFCGLQYDYPIRLKTPAKHPKNVIFINDRLDAELMLIKARSILTNSKHGTFLVYGENLNCYTCINSLIEMGVAPKRITYIRPKPLYLDGLTTMFDDPYVDSLIDEMLLASGIALLDNSDIIEWRLDADQQVLCILVESDLRVLDLPCSLLISFERKIVARRNIQMLNAASLVFDGRLVIDADCRTNDECIYAAGPMTKYRRILHANHLRHQYFSSREVGERLARKTIEALSPLRSFGEVVQKFTVEQTVHEYRRCVHWVHQVLGGLHFVAIRKPGKPLPHEMQRNLSSYGVDLVTGQNSGADDANYCRVHLNAHNRVETIVSLTKKPINVHRYLALWNCHEAILNNLSMRFEAYLIGDLHEYFRSPWTYLLYHNRYVTDLKPRNEAALMRAYYPDANFIEEIGNAVVKNKWMNLTERQRTVFVEKFMTSAYEAKVRDNLVEFIVKNIDELSMFYDCKNMCIS